MLQNSTDGLNDSQVAGITWARTLLEFATPGQQDKQMPSSSVSVQKIVGTAQYPGKVVVDCGNSPPKKNEQLGSSHSSSFNWCDYTMSLKTACQCPRN